jgi:general secretion pathway protein D
LNRSLAACGGALWLALAGAAALADGVAQLGSAVQLYQQGDFEQARRELVLVNPQDLNAGQRRQLDQYLELTDLALSERAQAQADLEQAQAVLQRGKDQQARNLLDRVVRNGFASKSQKEAAEQILADMSGSQQRKLQLAASAQQPVSVQEQADALVRDGYGSLNNGDINAAQVYFDQALELVPGHPEATRGLEQVERHLRVEGPLTAQEGGLLHQVAQRRLILWQRAVATYRETEREIMELLAADRYKEANQKLLLAREAVEAGRQYADPISDYESLLVSYQALADQVRTREQTYNQTRTEQLRKDTASREAERKDQEEQERRREVQLLMEQAQQRVDDRDYDGAVQILNRVLIIDPQNVEAEFWRDELKDKSLVRKQVEIDQVKEWQTRRMLVDVEETKIPWFEEINYPKDWIERTRSPWRQTPGEIPLEGGSESLEESFTSRIPEISFNQAPLGEALDQLASFGRFNMVPNWPDLATAGISRDTPVTLKLRDVPLRTALDELLEQVEGASLAQVGYSVRDDVVKVATNDFLDRDTFTRVYPVLDLIQPIEHQTGAPDMDLRKITEKPYAKRDEAGRVIFDSDEEEDQPERSATERDELAELVNLIQEKVRPNSWREHGGQHCSIHARNDGNLVVTQTALGHQEIFNLLDQLREDRAVQISIEARFLTVSNNFLEDMGIDLDIILNNGNAGFDRQAGAAPGSFVIDPSTGGALLLPRQFGRLGFTPATAPVGVGIPPGPTAVQQPYTNVGFVPSATGNDNNTTPIPFLNNVLDYTSRLQSDVPGSFAGSQLPPAMQIFGSFLDNIQVDFLIRATQADSRASTMLAPKLILTNGQQAWIAITNQQNFVSTLVPVVASGAAAQAPITQTIDTGAVLDVQAVASPDRRYVTMNIQPGVGRLIAINEFKFSDAPISGVGASGFVQLPVVQRQQIKTTVSVPDGGTLMVGGQKVSAENEIESGVPVLSKIPILKRIYSARAMVKDEQVLLILIKPRILIQEEQEELAAPGLSSR